MCVCLRMMCREAHARLSMWNQKTALLSHFSTFSGFWVQTQLARLACQSPSPAGLELFTLSRRKPLARAAFVPSLSLSCLRKTGKLMEASLHSVTDRVSPIKIMLMFEWPKGKNVQGPKNYIFQMWDSTCSFLHWRDANLPSKHGFWTLSIIMACWYFLL